MDFFTRIRRGLGIATGKSLAVSSGFTIRDDDVFLVSYPKSGNTWARFLLSNAISPSGYPVDFRNIDKIIPDIYKVNLYDLHKMQGRRIIKSHSSFNPLYPKVIYIVRNPFDVATSYFFYSKKIGSISNDMVIEDYIDKFINDPGEFGTWEQNVKSWIYPMIGKDNFILIKYEDLLDNAANTIQRMLKFINVNAAREMDEIISLSSFDNMKNLERRQHSKWLTTKNSDPKIPFVRKGMQGSWREDMNRDCARKISSRWGDFIQSLGYDLIF